METHPTNTTSLVPASAKAGLPTLNDNLQGVSLTSLGVISTRNDLSREEYHSLFHTALVISRASNWVLGDTLNLAERLWGNKAAGSKYAEAAAFTGLSVSALKQISLTCKAIPLERRHADLSFSHHVEARSHTSNPELQDRALAQAAEKKQSIRAMRKAMRSERATNSEGYEQPELSAGAENDDRPFGMINLPQADRSGTLPRWDALNFIDWVKNEDPFEYDLPQCEQTFQLMEPLIDYLDELKAHMEELRNTQDSHHDC